MNNNFSLSVNTEELKNLADYLTTSITTLDTTLDELSENMQKLDSSWMDLDGVSYISKFNDFVKDFKKINMEIDILGKFASSMTNNYENILNSHLSRMLDGD